MPLWWPLRETSAIHFPPFDTADPDKIGRTTFGTTMLECSGPPTDTEALTVMPAGPADALRLRHVNTCDLEVRWLRGVVADGTTGSPAVTYSHACRSPAWPCRWPGGRGQQNRGAGWWDGGA